MKEIIVLIIQIPMSIENLPKQKVNIEKKKIPKSWIFREILKK